MALFHREQGAKRSKRGQANRIGLGKRRLRFEMLEDRRVLAPLCGESCMEVEMLPEFDQFGSQIGVFQAYEDADGPRLASSIFDTGASVVTFAANEQVLLEFFDQEIPIKVPGGASADAIGGVLTGDVSEPGTIHAVGMHAWEFDPDTLAGGVDMTQGVSIDGVQMFVGTATGSPQLPTILGTPILRESASNPDGLAARIGMQAYELNFGELFPDFPEFEGLVVPLPDIFFEQAGAEITPPADGSTTPAMRIPLSLFGGDNYDDPGDMITYSHNPVQDAVSVYQDDAGVTDQTFLFDTGAQLSVVSTAIAEDLGLDLASPETSITVQGAAGTADIPGYTIDALDLPRDDNGDGEIDGVLRFTNAPIYVLDVAEGLDGILGMNLFNTADEIIYDPNDPAGPSFSTNFFTARELPDLGEQEEEADALEALAAANPLFGDLADAASFVPGFDYELDPSWRNPANAHDVDGDGEVKPRDVLVLIDDINRRGIRDLPPPPSTFRTNLNYLDVDGDGGIDPEDALHVINAINNGAAAEGEASVNRLRPLSFTRHAPVEEASADLPVAPPAESEVVAKQDDEAPRLEAKTPIAVAAPLSNSPALAAPTDAAIVEFFGSSALEFAARDDFDLDDHVWDDALDALLEPTSS